MLVQPRRDPARTGTTRYGGGVHEARRPAPGRLGPRARAALLHARAARVGAYVYQGEELGLEEVEDLPEDVLQDPTW